MQDSRCIRNPDALFYGLRHINIVESGSKIGDELQILAAINNVPVNFVR